MIIRAMRMLAGFCCGALLLAATTTFATGFSARLRLAPTPQVVWRLLIGSDLHDSFSGLARRPDGGVYLTGTAVIKGRTRIWLVRLSPQQKVLWIRSLDAGDKAGGRAVVVTKDGGCIVTGWVIRKPTRHDILVARFSADGKVVWKRVFGGGLTDQPFGLVKAKDGVLVIGATQSKGAGSYDAWLLRLDGKGKLLWDRTYGGGDMDSLMDGVATRDGFVLAGGTWSTGAGKEDFWLVKVDHSGKLIWQHTYGGKEIEEAKSLTATKDGGFVLVGGTYSFGAGKEDVWVVKVDRHGKKLWDRTYGGKKWDGGSSVVATRRGLAVLAWTKSKGAGGVDIWVLKLSHTGVLRGQWLYGDYGADIGRRALLTKKGLLIAGYSEVRGVMREGLLLLLDLKKVK